MAEDGISYRKIRGEWNQKSFLFVFLLLIFPSASVFPVGIGATSEARAGSPVILTVMNPRAELRGPNPVTLSPRLRTLEGKRIGLINNTKDNAALLQPELEKALREFLPTGEIKSWSIPYRPSETKAINLEEAARGSDGIILFIGD